MTTLHPGRLRRGVGLALLIQLILAGCGGGNSTGSRSRSGTPSNFDFGSNDPQLVDAFGDSITAGFLEEGHITSNNYPNNLQAMLRGLDPGWRVINRGVGGEEVQQGARRFPGVLGSDRPGFGLVMEGTNNADRVDDPAFVVASLQDMVHTARNNRTIPVLGTIPPNFREVTLFPYIRAVIEESNSMIRSMAAAEGVALAEIFNGMNDRGLFGAGDPHHPTEHGYQVMAGIWFEAMQRAVPSVAPPPTGGGSTPPTASPPSADLGKRPKRR